MDDMSIVAQALDGGADINAVDEGGTSALDICLDKWRSTDIWKEANIAHLLLYRETAIRSKGKTTAALLHPAILSGDVAMVACLIQDLTDPLRLFLQGGLSPPYIAPAFSHEDLAPFGEINRILPSNQINPDTALGYEGKSALHLRVTQNMVQSLSVLDAIRTRQWSEPTTTMMEKIVTARLSFLASS
jgi:ankyrin repeat protein